MNLRSLGRTLFVCSFAIFFVFLSFTVNDKLRRGDEEKENTFENTIQSQKSEKSQNEYV